MPREAPLSRSRETAPSTRATTRPRVVAAHAGLPYPPRAGNAPRPGNQGPQRQPPPPLERASGNGPRQPAKDKFQDPVHDDCRTIFRKATQERAKFIKERKELENQIQEQSQEAAEKDHRFNQEKSRYNAQARKVTMDLQKATREINALQKRLDESSPDLQTYVPRVEHEQVLDELTKLSSALTKKIESNKDASQNAFQTKEMPPSDALDEPWPNMDLNMFDDTIDPQDLDQILPTANDLPPLNLNSYGETS